MQFSKIMFLSDPLRHKSGQDGNADMFFGLLSGPIKRATNLESKLLDRDELAYLQKSIYKSYGFDIDNVDIKPSIFGGVPTEMWKALCFVEPNKETLEIVKFFFNDSFVVCREPSILIKKSLNILNIPFIEFAIHSVRFLDDLVLAATSNEESIYKKLLNYELDREEFFFHADLLKAESYRKNSFYANSINKPAAIFFAQTPVDRSLLDYRNRRLVSFFDYKDKFEQLTKEYEIVYYKSHPHYKNQEILNFLKKYPNVKIYDDKINTYMLLALPKKKKCVAISSGTINVAKYFGKECESWFDQPYHYSDEVCDKSKLNPVMYYITLNQQYMSSKFWADILSDFVQTNDISNVCCGGVNRFRRIIGTSWSFNDNNSCTIDSYISNSFLNINNLKGQISKINAKLDAASESEKKVLSILQTIKTQV